MRTDRCPVCGSGCLRTAFSYDRPPDGETSFSFVSGEYRRRYDRCDGCGHLVSVHEYDMSGLYDGDYDQINYPGDRLRKTYERIMALPTDASDNRGRVARVDVLARQRLPRDDQRALLDVGSGLGVFVAAMKEAGWRCTATDPDARVAEHTRTIVGVDAVQGDFLSMRIDPEFDVVSLNRVIEHVEDPVSMVARCRGALTHGGCVYLEVPDAEMAALDPLGQSREEFFIDHHHVFSMASLAVLVMRAGFAAECLGRIREPSGKYTLFGFLRLPQVAACHAHAHADGKSSGRKRRSLPLQP